MASRSVTYSRALGRGWRLIVVGAVLAALVASAVSLHLRNSAPTPAQHWEASHKLIVNPDAIEPGATPNLLQTALFVTGGAVPAEVAELQGQAEVELTPRVRTIVDETVQLIEVAVVSTSAQEAAELADAFALSLVELLRSQDRAAYERELAAAGAEVERRTERILALDEQIAELEVEIVALETVPLDEADEASARWISSAEKREPSTEQERTRFLTTLRNDLGLAQTERSAHWELYAEAVQTLDDLSQVEPSAALLVTQDVVEPRMVSAGEFERRLADGLAGVNNYAAADVPGEIRGQAAPPWSRSVAVTAAMGALLGAVLVGGTLVLRARLDTRLRGARELEDAFGVAALSEVPVMAARHRDSGEVHAISQIRSPVTEAYRKARSALLHAGSQLADTSGSDPRHAGATVGDDVCVVMVTSPGPSDGKTTTVANLGVLLAESGLRVLAVNVDHRSPQLHSAFGLRYEPRRTLEVGVEGLVVVADAIDAQVTNPSMVVAAQRELVQRARGQFDVILMDAAPLLATDDATALLPLADLVIPVVRAGWTRHDETMACAELLRRRGAPVAGPVLTASTEAGREPRRRQEQPVGKAAGVGVAGEIHAAAERLRSWVPGLRSRA